ncbi:MAG: tetratricopeptide repeat protein [Deltaproteobacteria bacterium]|jgi:tetratricopeptide (TPR) repeat protein
MNGATRIAAPLLATLLVACPASEEYLRKGNVMFSNGQLDQAEQFYAQALEADEDSVRALDGLGNVAFERKKYDVAIDFYERAVKVNPDAIAARHHLAVALSSAGRIEDAKKALLATIESAPDDVFAFFSLGGLYDKSGDAKQAEEMFAKALAIDEDHRPSRYALAILLTNAGRTEEAERQLTRLTQAGAKGLAAYGYARIAAKAGENAEAAKHLEDVLAAGVDHPEKILADAAFSKAWSAPEMQAVRKKLAATTSTVSE